MTPRAVLLSSHTSGIFNVGDEGDVIADIDHLTDPALLQQGRAALAHYLAGEPVLISADLYVALAETHERYFAPGTGNHYSNVNYQLVGMVLEHVTGQALPICSPVASRSPSTSNARLSPSILACCQNSTGFAARRTAARPTTP